MNMVDAGFLAGMKDGAFSSSTLPAATFGQRRPLPKPLCSGKIAGAGLDTIAPETGHNGKSAAQPAA